MFQSIRDCAEEGINLTTMDRHLRESLGRVPIDLLEIRLVVRAFLDTRTYHVFYRLAKRLMDLAAGSDRLIALVILFPLLALVILLDSGRPIHLHTQQRLGRGESRTPSSKLRTMKSNSDMEKEALVTATNDPRITRIEDCYEKPTWMNCLRSSTFYAVK
jgi:hypothetical protein